MLQCADDGPTTVKSFHQFLSFDYVKLQVLELLSDSNGLGATERWKMLEHDIDEMDDCSVVTDCYYPY